MVLKKGELQKSLGRIFTWQSIIWILFIWVIISSIIDRYFDGFHPIVTVWIAIVIKTLIEDIID